jgi:CYTH domain-containing protein
MAVEIERKFLVDKALWQKKVKPGITNQVQFRTIKQKLPHFSSTGF